MIRTIIVEDEVPILRGIATLIEKIDPEYKILARLKNGKEAINYIDNNKIDLIITDINMPLVNGIDVLKYIYENGIDVYKIVLSGYGDFEYTKKAIEYGVSEYIMKPITKDELISVLNKIKQLYNKKTHNEYLVKIKKALFENTVVAEDLTIGNLVCVCIGNLIYEDSYEFFRPNISHLINIKQELLSYLQKNKNYYALEWKNSNEILIVSLEKFNFEEHDSDIVDFLKNRNNNFSIAYTSDSLCLSNIKQKAKELRKCIYKVANIYDINIINNDKILCCKEVKPDIFEELRNTVLDGKISASDFINAYRFIINKLGIEENINKVKDNMIHCTSKLDFINTIEVDLSSNFSNDNNADDVILSIKKYILENIASSLSVNEIAKYFNFSPSYISRLFKEKEDKNLYQYIQNLKMEKAKNMILNLKNIKIKDIAIQLGYENQMHFSKVFKKFTNMYPMQYKKLNEGKNDKL